jgi:hypothetical protein
MHHPFIPLVLLGLLPLAYFTWRLGWLRHRFARSGLVAAAALVLGVGIWAGGMDFVHLKRIKILIAALVAAGLLVRGARQRASDPSMSTAWRLAAGGLVVTAWVVYLNFFSFHGARTYVHLHDVAHYYLGAKYFAELGYGNIYLAMLRAEAETFDDHFKAIEARDLRTNTLVHIRPLLEQSGPAKARFDAQRWADFQRDVAYFRNALGAQYGDILRDHGFNPTPFWALIGGTIANLVPAGSADGIRLLCMLDPLLLVVMFALVGRAFGGEVACLAMLYYCVFFGAGFGWMGGAFLRHMWLFSTVVAACCLHRGRPALAGSLLAAAVLLRLFPVAFLLGPVCRIAWTWRGDRDAARAPLALVGSCAATAVLLLALSGLVPGGLGRWQEFRSNLERHMQHTAYNTIGLTEILAYRGAARPTTPETFATDLDRRRRLRGAQLLALLPLAVLVVARRSRRRGDLEALALGATLPVFVGLNLAAYYYVFYLVVLLALRRHPEALATMFAAEALSHALPLFEDRDVVVFFYRNVVVLYLLAALHLAERQPAFLPGSRRQGIEEAGDSLDPRRPMGASGRGSPGARRWPPHAVERPRIRW